MGKGRRHFPSSPGLRRAASSRSRIISFTRKLEKGKEEFIQALLKREETITSSS